MSQSNPQQAAQFIQQQYPEFQANIAIILGSGLNDLVDSINQVAKIAYQAIPGFPAPTVQGHEGQLVLGHIGETGVICLQGRAHLYEGTSIATLQTMIRSLKYLGCETLIITNAAGSLHHDLKPSQLMLISDHINMQTINPLVGPNEDDLGPRFVNMENAYDNKLRQILLDEAKQLSITMTEGVYLATMGPNFETPAEIRAFRKLGADAVGMSTAAEVMLARHCGIKVLAISAISNLAAGMSEQNINHNDVLSTGKIACQQLQPLLTNFINTIS